MRDRLAILSITRDGDTVRGVVCVVVTFRVGDREPQKITAAWWNVRTFGNFHRLVWMRCNCWCHHEAECGRRRGGKIWSDALVAAILAGETGGQVP